MFIKLTFILGQLVHKIIQLEWFDRDTIGQPIFVQLCLTSPMCNKIQQNWDNITKRAMARTRDRYRVKILYTDRISEHWNQRPVTVLFRLFLKIQPIQENLHNIWILFVQQAYLMQKLEKSFKLWTSVIQQLQLRVERKF